MNDNKRDNVLTYIKIATKYCSNFIEPTEGKPYDENTLAVISACINRASTADPFAEKLYTEARAQLLMLDGYMQGVEINSEDFSKLIIEENDNSTEEARRLIENLKNEDDNVRRWFLGTNLPVISSSSFEQILNKRYQEIKSDFLADNKSNDYGKDFFELVKLFFEFNNKGNNELDHYRQQVDYSEQKALKKISVAYTNCGISVSETMQVFENSIRKYISDENSKLSSTKNALIAERKNIFFSKTKKKEIDNRINELAVSISNNNKTKTVFCENIRTVEKNKKKRLDTLYEDILSAVKHLKIDCENCLREINELFKADIEDAALKKELDKILDNFNSLIMVRFDFSGWKKIDEAAIVEDNRLLNVTEEQLVVDNNKLNDEEKNFISELTTIIKEHIEKIFEFLLVSYKKLAINQYILYLIKTYMEQNSEDNIRVAYQEIMNKNSMPTRLDMFGTNEGLFYYGMLKNSYVFEHNDSTELGSIDLSMLETMCDYITRIGGIISKKYEANCTKLKVLMPYIESNNYGSMIISDQQLNAKNLFLDLIETNILLNGTKIKFTIIDPIVSGWFSAINYLNPDIRDRIFGGDVLSEQKEIEAKLLTIKKMLEERIRNNSRGEGIIVLLVMDYPLHLSAKSLSYLDFINKRGGEYEIIAIYNKSKIDVKPNNYEVSNDELLAEVEKGIPFKIGFGDGHFNLMNRKYFKQDEFVDFMNVLSEVMEKSDIEKRTENNEMQLDLFESISKGQDRTHFFVPLTKDNNGSLVNMDLSQDHFALFLAGNSGSGKSTVLHFMITGIICSYNPDDIDLWLIDFKKVEFSKYISLLPPHVKTILLEKSADAIEDMFSTWEGILESRKKYFEIKHYRDYSMIPQNVYMPRIVIVIDEFTEFGKYLLQLEDGGYKQRFESLILTSRSYGFNFILSAQNFSYDNRFLGETTRNNIQTHLAMKMDSAEIRQMFNTSDFGLSDDEKNELFHLDKYQIVQMQTYDSGKRVKYNRYRTVGLLDENQLDIINQRKADLVGIKEFSLDNEKYLKKNQILLTESLVPGFRNYVDDMDNCEKKYRKIGEDNIYIYVGKPMLMDNVLPIKLNNRKLNNIIYLSDRLYMQLGFIKSIDESISRMNNQGNNIELRIVCQNNYDKVREMDLNCLISEDDNISLFEELYTSITDSDTNFNRLYVFYGFKQNKYSDSKEQTEESFSLDDLLDLKKQQNVLDLSDILKSDMEIETSKIQIESKDDLNIEEKIDYVFKHGYNNGIHFITIVDDYDDEVKKHMDRYGQRIVSKKKNGEGDFIRDFLNERKLEIVSSVDRFYTKSDNELYSYIPYYWEGISENDNLITDDGDFNPDLIIEI